MDILTIPDHIAKDTARLNKFIKALSCPKCSAGGQLETSTGNNNIGIFRCCYCDHCIILKGTQKQSVRSILGRKSLSINFSYRPPLSLPL